MDSLGMVHALLAIHHSTPTIISTPSLFNPASTPQPATPITTSTPASSNRRNNIGSNRRASVAIIIRIAPGQSHSSQSSFTNSPASSPKLEFQSSSLLSSNYHPDDLTQQLRQFFAQEWVQSGTPEVFFIERATRTNDRWSAHLAFPGGRMEPEDEDGLFCAMRETWEEVGIDLAEKEFIPIGRLDDREITTSLGKRLLMVLSPYVFLSTHRDGGPMPTLEPSEVTAAYWVPLYSLAGPQTRWGEMTIDLSTRLAPSRGPLIKLFLRSLVGSMRFRSILLPHNPIIQVKRHSKQTDPQQVDPTPDLNLWGLTLGMTLDLLSFFKTPSASLPNNPNLFRSPSLQHLNVPPLEIMLVAPSITSIFPRFTHPDINALIWLLGRRYRNLIKQCHQQQQQVRAGAIEGDSDEDQSTSGRGGGGGTRGRKGQKMTINYLNNQISWTSLTMKEFYRSVRKALILSVLLRILSVTSLLSTISFFWGPRAIASSRRFLSSLWARSAPSRLRRLALIRRFFFLRPS
ncbi:hypothetical protein PCASD_04569 [Puccinia coronata f. sp. avenae]|uniref:Nudix hydrolase domain-containing protein n=1 Tax=Puccinia coronata f. sp. avenae TaxID=200324 RepID=A0A2N5V578_9BASI|nr:hypothetical protein PCASD_04569 [Puccinia coronata f. sp. avenae]